MSQVPCDQDHDVSRAALARGLELPTTDGGHCYQLLTPTWQLLASARIEAGQAFPEAGSSFPLLQEGALAVLRQVERQALAFPGARLAVFGHASGGADPEGLSRARARALLAALQRDVAAWQDLDQAEGWGLGAAQRLLRVLGHDPGRVDGEVDEATRAALKRFQAEAGLEQSGQDDAPTREALFGAYLDQLGLDLPEGSPLEPGAIGCGAFNPLEGGGPASERVVFFLFHPERLPALRCQDGCAAHPAPVDRRAVPSFGCRCYDLLARGSCEG